MTQEDLRLESDGDEINIFELMEYLKSGWQWLAGGCAVGLLGVTGYLMATPAKYEASVVIQPATVSMNVAATPSLVEPIAHTIERVKIVSFYSDDLVKACSAVSAKDMLKGVKVSTVKGANLISLSYYADSAAQAEACMAKIARQLNQSQIDIAAPLIKELENQRVSTKQQIDDVERFLAQHEKGLSSAPIGAVLLMLKREELMNLRKVYREQRIQLTEPLTQSMKLLEPMYAPEGAVFPNKLLTVIGGVIGGLFVGLLALSINRNWRRYKSMSL